MWDCTAPNDIYVCWIGEDMKESSTGVISVTVPQKIYNLVSLQASFHVFDLLPHVNLP